MQPTILQQLSGPRIPSIDGIRAISIVCVLWAHAVGTHGFPIAWAPEGVTGVQMFFVISGFIITTLLLKEQDDRTKISLSGFYRRRAARILPAFWAYLAAVAALGFCRIIPFNIRTDALQPITFTMGFPWWPGGLAWEIRHTWSLSIEQQFYLLWPPLLMLLPRYSRGLIPLAIIIGGPLARVWIYDHPKSHALSWSILCNADVLAWGCLVAIARSDYPQMIDKIVSWRPAAARVAAIAVITFAPWYFHRAFVRKCPELSANTLVVSAQAAAIAFLILSATEIRRGIMYAALNLRVLIWIGLLSYSLYLWQQLFLSGAAHWWTCWPLNIILTFAAAAMSYFLIERPIRKLNSKVGSTKNPSALEPDLVALRFDGPFPLRID